jgi:NADH dehydrogenase
MVRGTDFPLEQRGRITVKADLRIVDGETVVPDAWACGDVAATPDLTGKGVGGFCVPNAQHAVRMGKRLAKNIVASLRGEGLVDYKHENLGAVAGLGLNVGVFQSGKFAMKGFPAWAAHRGYHGMAMPSFERKFRVVGGWWNNFWLGRDIVSLDNRERPRAAFEEFASRPKPAVETPAEAPAAAVGAGAGQPAGEAGPAYANPVEDDGTAKKGTAEGGEASSKSARQAPARKPAVK